ncbi:MAG: hypothetical protein A2048_06535 [Deltaproteobacteria bacterium GWA2_45_12]|nr:MAG: hypothetical protein A2048_06535 [Deltaproteobacteria bacterium GWA2_45_12]
MTFRFIKIIGTLIILLGFNYLFKNIINPYITQIVCLIGINLIMGLSLNLISGQTGQFSLGHAGFMALGAYTSAFVTFYGEAYVVGVLSFLPAVVVQQALFVVALVSGGLVASLAGLVVGIPTLRLTGDYLAIATLGFAEIVRVSILNTEVLGGARGFTGIGEYGNFFWIFLCVVITTLVLKNMVYSTKGLAFLAVRDNEIAAQAMGINIARQKVFAFVTSAFFAGVGGGLFAHLMTYLNTNSFGFLKSVEFVVMIVLGGLGSMSGVFISATLLTVLPEVLRAASEWRMVVYSLLLILMMILRPQGLLGMREIFKKR